MKTRLCLPEQTSTVRGKYIKITTPFDLDPGTSVSAHGDKSTIVSGLVRPESLFFGGFRQGLFGHEIFHWITLLYKVSPLRSVRVVVTPIPCIFRTLTLCFPSSLSRLSLSEDPTFSLCLIHRFSLVISSSPPLEFSHFVPWTVNVVGPTPNQDSCTYQRMGSRGSDGTPSASHLQMSKYFLIPDPSPSYPLFVNNSWTTHGSWIIRTCYEYWGVPSTIGVNLLLLIPNLPIIGCTGSGCSPSITLILKGGLNKLRFRYETGTVDRGSSFTIDSRWYWRSITVNWVNITYWEILSGILYSA